ncbi:hypothetical protein MRB53_025080 [Persea americana]|uniref:Uncharacterized protein n=1 Tax=Persea americana TaxID=3435 RepID=A0ACC2LF80_PERAE|nr:hypothetical protein MRB53_025080 [Persea americana]|eukprot:TRINITY_DN4605_c0_g1_i2.p1 TRINITY_DN4605_c0_g1~~TRINITY_DN4605_c0_g1_i2.p1  ORF type:complete len:255 (-),score=61.94 TRINITY_DN4605_c0_g1_i2:350-1114(-)
MEEDKIDPFEISSAEWNKKRKLQGEQLGMPSPKHKFRDRCCGAEIKSPTTDDKEAEDNIHDCPIEDETNGGSGDRIEGCESVKDSNSFIEESDTATMPVDSEDKPNAEIGTNYLDWLSISSSSSSIKNYRSNCNFPASMAIKSGEESTHVCTETNPAILGDDLQLGGGIPSSEDHLDELGMNYYDFIHSEYKNDRKEHSTEIAAEEMMLYSNDVPSNLYVLSSGRWSVGPDARLSARKPTIDQEFEQYFSTLML